jgi:hypothetical protein
VEQALRFALKVATEGDAFTPNVRLSRLSDMYPFHPSSYSHVVCRHFQGDLLDVYPGAKAPGYSV